jgi:predicted lactoylglutathione lyase
MKLHFKPVHLPVKNLEKSRAFFFTIDPRISGANAACLHVVEGAIARMLTTASFFASLIDKPVKKGTTMIVESC